MFDYIRNLFEIKRMNDIMDLIKAEQLKRLEKEREYIEAHIKDEDFVIPRLYQPRYHFGYDHDERYFIRFLMEGNTNEEVVKKMMEYYDRNVDSSIELYKLAQKKG